MNKIETRAEYIESFCGKINPTLYGEYIESISIITKLVKALGVSVDELLK